MEFELAENEIIEPDYVELPDRGRRRKTDFNKAKRKQFICHSVYLRDWYEHLHQYSKNKIHCSCPLCNCKTRYHNDKGGSNINWSYKDQKRLDDMREQRVIWLEDSPV